MYFNSVTGGKVFIENSGCTIGGIPGAWARKKKLPGEKKFLCTSAGQVKKQKIKRALARKIQFKIKMRVALAQKLK